MPAPWLQIAIATLAATAAGAVNSIAGGGTLITFPALLALGVPPTIANQTSTVALVPGTLAAARAYRGALRGARSWAVWFMLPSIAGGLIGALLLLVTSERLFAALVPYLILTATVIFLTQGPVTRMLGIRARAAGPAASPDHDLPPPPGIILFYQMVAGIYGGYFGAGIGILMLAALALMGLTDIHQMNGLKNWAATCINLTAVGVFIVRGHVLWPFALAMACGAALGGHVGAGLAQRVSQTAVRRAIVVIGFVAAGWYFVS